jgi:hypothetical protein
MIRRRQSFQGCFFRFRSVGSAVVPLPQAPPYPVFRNSVYDRHRLFQDRQRLFLIVRDRLETTPALLRCYFPKHEFTGDHHWRVRNVEEHSLVLSGQKLPTVAFTHLWAAETQTFRTSVAYSKLFLRVRTRFVLLGDYRGSSWRMAGMWFLTDSKKLTQAAA